jgi:hypothetical protein
MHSQQMFEFFLKDNSETLVVKKLDASIQDKFRGLLSKDIINSKNPNYLFSYVFCSHSNNL